MAACCTCTTTWADHISSVQPCQRTLAALTTRLAHHHLQQPLYECSGLLLAMRRQPCRQSSRQTPYTTATHARSTQSTMRGCGSCRRLQMTPTTAQTPANSTVAPPSSQARATTHDREGSIWWGRGRRDGHHTRSTTAASAPSSIAPPAHGSQAVTTTSTFTSTTAGRQVSNLSLEEFLGYIHDIVRDEHAAEQPDEVEDSDEPDGIPPPPTSSPSPVVGTSTTTTSSMLPSLISSIQASVPSILPTTVVSTGIPSTINCMFICPATTWCTVPHKYTCSGIVHALSLATMALLPTLCTYVHAVV